MIDKFVLMCKNVEVGDFTYDTVKKEFKFEKYENIDNRKYLPLGMYSYLNWNLEYIPTSDDIKFWIEERVMPKERQNVDEVLKAIGLLYYDAWEICRRTRAMCMEDYFWISKGEIYEEVHMRYLSERNRVRETPIPFHVENYPPEYSIVGDRIIKNEE